MIGFSLAQLGLSLVIPERAIDFVQRPVGIVAFVVTFAVVVRFWWTHFKIFRHYFEPNRLTITCNFVALAGLVLAVFSLQLYLHFVPLGQGMVAARIYFGILSLAFGALGAMFALGLAYRWGLLALAERRAGVRDLLAILGTVLGCTIGNFVSTNGATNVFVEVAGHRQIVATAPSTIFLYTLVGWLAGMVAGRIAPRYVTAE